MPYYGYPTTTSYVNPDYYGYGYYGYANSLPYWYYNYDSNDSMVPITLFSLVSFLMQISGFAIYTKSIKDKTDGTNYKGMLFANQLTWAMTGFTGIWATMGGDTALNWFWLLSQLGFFGTIVFNWLGLFWAQYQREVSGVTSFIDSDNLIALGLNLLYNFMSFGLHLWLQGLLCSISQYEYSGSCYEDYYYYYMLFGKEVEEEEEV